MVRDEEIERIAVQEAIRHETDRGWVIESVETDNRGFDLISRKPHPHDDKTFTDVRFIEVKGRAAVGEIALSDNEYKTAERLKSDYWLYVVFNCGSTPELHPIQDPARLGWQPVAKVEHYHRLTGRDLRSGRHDESPDLSRSGSSKSTCRSRASRPTPGARNRSGTGTSRRSTSGGRGVPSRRAARSSARPSGPTRRTRSVRTPFRETARKLMSLRGRPTSGRTSQRAESFKRFVKARKQL